MTLAALVAAAVAILLLAGCARQDGHTYAVEACEHVQHSISYYDHAATSTDPAEQAHLQARALAELRTAMPLGALAASDDTQWQALAATLGESSRVGEVDLVHALQAQCQTVFAPQG